MMGRAVTSVSCKRNVGLALVALGTILIAGLGTVRAHLDLGHVLQLFSYVAELVPAPIDGNITPDAAPDKWRSAHVRSITFASQDGSVIKNGTLLLTNDVNFLYLGVGFNSQSAGNVNYAMAYFDENHDHMLDGTDTVSGEYFVRVEGSGPSIVTNGGFFGSLGWQSYSVTPAGLEGEAAKHGTGNPTTWNFEFKIPLNSAAGPGGENFLNVSDVSELGLLIEVNDASDGVLYWEPSGRDPLDASTWGDALLGVASPERDVAASITLGHDPVIDGLVSTEDEWLHYTTSVRAVQFTDYDGTVLDGTLYTKSNASDLYVGMVVDGVAANAGDRLTVFTDQDVSGSGDLDYALSDLAEHASRVTYIGTGSGAHTDRHFEATGPTWAIDAAPDGIGAVSHTGSGYEFEFRVPLSGTGSEDLQAPLGTRLGMNVEYFDVTTGQSFWWVFASNSSSQLMRVDALEHSALGWLRLQTGAPVIQPVFPKDADEVSGHFPFVIYTTSSGGELDIVSAEFSDDQGATWKTLERIDEGGLWNRTWDTTLLGNGPREIRMRAQDTGGLVATSVINVVVDNSGGGRARRPDVVLTAPDAGSYVSGSTDITFTVTPASGFTILDSEVSIDGDAYASATSPYAWDTTLENDGSHVFRARALQSDSLYGFSEVRLVRVDNTPPEVEAVQVAYPAGQTSARVGDVVTLSALVRDDGAGLDVATVILDSNALDGAVHTLLDDGTQGDAVAGDHVYTDAVTVTTTTTGPASVSVAASDILGNASGSIVANVQLDNTAPSHVATVSSDADAIYKNTDVIKLTTTWESSGHRVSVDFSAVDDNYVAGAEQVVDNADGTYTITYAISFENAVADATSLALPITAFDAVGNGPAIHAGFTVQLDNTAPAFTSVDSGQDNYADADMVVLTATLDDSTYHVWSDFSMIDSDYMFGSESVSNVGNVYTITYAISDDSLNTTPDGSYDIPVHAEDLAGNRSALSTSVELDNTPEAVTILQPRDGDLLTGDVTIEVTSADDTRFVRFQVSDDGGKNWYNLDGTTTPNDYTQDDDASDGWMQTWKTAADSLQDGVDYWIRVLAYDEQDPTPHLIGEDTVAGGLIVDNTPPTLTIEVLPIPTDTPLSGRVYSEEILLRGTYFDLPDSARVVGLTIVHRNPDGDDVNDSPIAVPAEDNSFSRRMRLVPGLNHLTVTAIDEAGLTTSQSADLDFVSPEDVVTIGPAGGIVRSPDGTTLKVPPDALQSFVDISVTRVPPDELFPTSDARVTLLKVAHTFEPTDLVFHRPVEIVLTYADADLDSDQNGVPDDPWNETTLESFFWDGFQWVRTDVPDRDPLGNTVTFRTNHLATFDLGVTSTGSTDVSVYWTRNPMNPAEGTTCVFDLPSPGRLSLQIYDLSGHLVRNIVSGERVDVMGSLRWDGMSDFDGFVGSGVYVYVFRFSGVDGRQVTVRKPLGVVK
jgi:hypothetical protein